MQLIIDSKPVVDITMSALEESQDNQINAVIADVKKDLQTIKDKDVLVVKTDEESESNDTIKDTSDPEAKTNGEVENTNVNGISESPSNNKENDAPQVESEAPEEESIENISHCVNSLFGLGNDIGSETSATEKATTESALETEPSKETNVTAKLVNNLLDNEKPEWPGTELINALSSIPSKPIAVEDTKQDSPKPDEEAPVEKEVEEPEKLKEDVENLTESQSKNEENCSSNDSDNDKTTAPQENCESDTVSNNLDIETPHSGETVSCPNIDDSTSDKQVEIVNPSNENIENGTEETTNFQNHVNNTDEDVSDQQVASNCDKSSTAIESDNDASPTKDNITIEQEPSKSETPSDNTATENIKIDVITPSEILDQKIIENETNEEISKIGTDNDISDRILLDNESKDVTDDISAQNKECDKITEIPGTEDKKDADSVSVSSMEVDEVEIVPSENDESPKNVEACTDNTQQDNNIIDLDQDTVETSCVKDESKTNEQSQDTNIIETSDPPSEIKNKDDISDEDDIKIVEEVKTKSPEKETADKVENKPLPVVCKLSNTLDILSDDEEEPPVKKTKTEEEKPQPATEDKQCINIDDDDDIMLIEDTKEAPEEPKVSKSEEKNVVETKEELCEQETCKFDEETLPKEEEKEIPSPEIESSPKISEKEPQSPLEEAKEPKKSLLPLNFLKSAKKNLAEMTRDELEEFCILKIVESIVDRSSLSEIKTKMKTIEQNMEEYKKKALVLTKQNRDLQVVLKSVQEEQKNRPNNAITPLKITRSVGMQVLMLDKGRKKPNSTQPVNPTPPKYPNRNTQPPKTPKAQSNNHNIPVPRLIPATPTKNPINSPVTNTAKPPTTNGIRNTPSPAQKVPEKRPHTRQSASAPNSNMTVDLTDDDPPAKVPKNSPVLPVRLVPPQNLLAPRPQTPQNNPRKVFIPINHGSGQTVFLKSMNQPIAPRGRFPAVPRAAQNQVRMNKITVTRHPAPLPDVMKQYQPPTWKALPPAPDLKLSKVENGIVISWKIEGYQEDSYEKIASYQLYAYQETATPPSTALWKKIGDVKALPLPMACTLTQFMAGFKYYFAVRAVDVKSRLGPFSLPGSILLLNKM